MNTYPELTTEEKAKRARIAELRRLIKIWATWRRQIKTAWHLNHSSTEFSDALAKLRADLQAAGDGDGAPVFARYEKWWGPQPDRKFCRDYVHELHVEYGNLRGKPHVCELVPAG
jgi:uncharacterized protein YjiS (DUF1127 family)